MHVIFVCVCVCLYFCRTAWVQKIKAASELFIETEKKKREKAYLGASLFPFLLSGKNVDAHNVMHAITAAVICLPVRSQRATGIGRLMVNIVEGIELKPCRSHGMNLMKEPSCYYKSFFI